MNKMNKLWENSEMRSHHSEKSLLTGTTFDCDLERRHGFERFLLALLAIGRIIDDCPGRLSEGMTNRVSASRLGSARVTCDLWTDPSTAKNVFLNLSIEPGSPLTIPCSADLMSLIVWWLRFKSSSICLILTSMLLSSLLRSGDPSPPPPESGGRAAWFKSPMRRGGICNSSIMYNEKQPTTNIPAERSSRVRRILFFVRKRQRKRF